MACALCGSHVEPGVTISSPLDVIKQKSDDTLLWVVCLAMPKVGNKVLG